MCKTQTKSNKDGFNLPLIMCIDFYAYSKSKVTVAQQVAFASD